jgi:nucleotide-binding universal stress UspA family protein
MHARDNLFVVAVDFWQPSLNALEMAVRLARQYDGHLLVVHVVEPQAHFPEGMVVDEDTQDEDLQRALDALVKPYQDSGIAIETALCEGKVTRQLSDLVHENQADALFVGLRQGRILEDVFIGTHTLQLLKIGEIPLMIVDATPHQEELQELMIPVDRRFGIAGTLQFLRELERPLAASAKLLVGMKPGEDKVAVLAEVNDIADELEALGMESVNVDLFEDQDLYGAMMDLIRNSVGTYDLVLLEQQDHLSLGELTLGSLIEDVVVRGRMPVLCAPAPKKR